jgi:integrase
VCTYRINRRKRLAVLGGADVLTLDQPRKRAMASLGKAASQQDPLEESDRLRQLKTVEELCTAEHPYAANRILEVVRKMFNWGKVAGLVPRDHANPAVGIVRFRERKRKRFITTMEMPRFINALEQEDNDYARHGIWLLVLMGVRSNELLKAKWMDLNWDMRTLFVGLTKNGEPLLAPLSEAALARLRVICRRGFYHIAFLDSSCRVPRNAGSRSRHIVVASTRILHRCQDRAICRVSVERILCAGMSATWNLF